MMVLLLSKLLAVSLYMQLLDLERYVSLERCRLVKYDDYSETLDQSFEDQEVGGGRKGGEG